MKNIRNRHVYVVSFLIVIFLGYFELGGFMKIKVKERDIDTQTIAYVSFTGNMFAYHCNVDKVEKELEIKGITGIGKMSIYYNLHTDKRSEDKKNDVGVLVDSQDVGRLDKESSIYKVMTISGGKNIVAEFPYKGALSCMMGHIRGTKVVHEHLKLHNNEYATIVELYNTRDNTIYYITEPQK